jgi:hypothetical protein
MVAMATPPPAPRTPQVEISALESAAGEMGGAAAALVAIERDLIVLSGKGAGAGLLAAKQARGVWGGAGMRNGGGAQGMG